MKNKKNISHNLKALHSRIAKLTACSGANLEDAVCDIIDLGGYSVAVLLKSLNTLPENVQSVVIRKLEDFIYFHPENGIKFIKRIIDAVKTASPSNKASLIAMLADIVEHEEDESAVKDMKPEILDVLSGDTDPARMARAVELVSKLSGVESIPHIMRLMVKHCQGIANAANYQFIETSLLSLKRLGGEPIVRLLINPSSADAIRQLRLEWGSGKDELLQSILKEFQTLDTEFAQMMLKVIDLSDFNLPFVAMIKEGLSHTDKWVRQEAAAGMQKAAEAFNPETLSRMLTDDEEGVRLMAATSLGGFSSEQTGTVLEALALKPGESLEIRLNALYALFAQKNLSGLENVVSGAETAMVKVNAEGLASLLMNHDKGLDRMIQTYMHTISELSADAGRYLLEIAEPEDIGLLTEAHASAKSETHRERMILFLKQFLEKKAGPRLNAALTKLSPAEQKALALLMPVKKEEADDKKAGHAPHGHSCPDGCGHHH